MLRLYLSVNNLGLNINVKTKIDKLVEYIDNRMLFYIIDVFNSILNDCVSNLSTIFNDERSIRNIIYAAIPQELYLYKTKEHETLHGRSDLELITKKHVWLLNLNVLKPTKMQNRACKQQ